MVCVCKKLHLPTYDWNTVALQSLGETTCGHWASFFLANGPKNWWVPLGPDPEANDALIRHLVRCTSKQRLGYTHKKQSKKGENPLRLLWMHHISLLFFCRPLVGYFSNGVDMPQNPHLLVRVEAELALQGETGDLCESAMETIRRVL